jgi:predicted O-linked N-acetylglucosamine transferase (SPINDLY family)
LKDAEIHYGAGRLLQAEIGSRTAIGLAPHYFDALHLLGILCAQSGRLAEALTYLKRAAEVHGEDAECHFNIGNLLRALGRPDEAHAAFEAAISRRPRFAEAYNNLGNVQRDMNLNALALGNFEQAIALKADFPEALSNKARMLLDLGRDAEALDCAERALRLRPQFADALNIRGAALAAIGNLPEALTSLLGALRIQPDLIEARVNAGSVLRSLGRAPESLEHLRHALAVKRDFAPAHNGLALSFHSLRRLEEALESCVASLELDPAQPDFYNARGAILQEMRRLEQALASYEAASHLRPNDARAHRNRGAVLMELGRFEEAALALDKALELEPEHPWLEGMSLFARLQVCDWRDYSQRLRLLSERIAAGAQAAQPFVTLVLLDSLHLQACSASAWSRASTPFVTSSFGLTRRLERPLLHIAYYSADFHNHATAYLAAQMFEQHNRTRFKVFGFSYGPVTNDPMQRRLRDAFDEFIDVRNLSDQQVADLSRSLEIDIAVDLKGFTQGARSGIFALRAAPVQVSYLGYPGTMCSPYMDYLIADRCVIPEYLRQHYSERILYLPHSYQVNDRNRPVASDNHAPAEHRLPAQAFVFCCFNNAFKIAPPIFDIWMRLLGALPQAVLWLLSDSAAGESNLRQEAEVRGVEGSRLIFAERRPLDEHLARHHHADLFLDTWPYNAHTTASDALWMGLPVLTMAGESFASRVAASLLLAADLPELITNSPAEYEQAALHLATNQSILESIRARLLSVRDTCNLFNSGHFTRSMELAFESMHAEPASPV